MVQEALELSTEAALAAAAGESAAKRELDEARAAAERELEEGRATHNGAESTTPPDVSFLRAAWETAQEASSGDRGRKRGRGSSTAARMGRRRPPQMSEVPEDRDPSQ